MSSSYTTNDNELREEIERLKILIEFRDNKIKLLEKELDEKSDRKRLNMIINLRENKIQELEFELKRLKEEYKDQVDFEKKKKELHQNIEAFEKRRINAYYYETLMDILKDNEFLQGEWVKFMTFLKMSCDPDEVKRLGG